jgi:hypothetical protein
MFWDDAEGETRTNYAPILDFYGVDYSPAQHERGRLGRMDRPITEDELVTTVKALLEPPYYFGGGPKFAYSAAKTLERIVEASLQLIP